MALTVSSMTHTHHDMNGHIGANPFWPQSMNISSSAPVDAYVQSGSPPSPSAHLGHGMNPYYDDNGGGSHLLDMAANGRKYLLSGTGSPPTGGMVGQDGRQQRSGSGTRTPSRNSSQDQYSAQLYKTELCRSFKETGYCRYGLKCRFAHGTPDLRPVQRHKKYKTEKCKNYQRDGNCPYGERCRFLHEDGELEELLLAEQMDGLVRETVSGSASANQPSSPYITGTGSPPTEHEFGQHLLYDTGSRFNATKPIPSRGSLMSHHTNNNPYNPYASQSVPTNMDLHPSLVYGRRPNDLTTSTSGDFSYGSPHITYDGDDEVLGRMEGMDDENGWLSRGPKLKQPQHQPPIVTTPLQQHHEHEINDYGFPSAHSTSSYRVGPSTSTDDIDRLTDDVMDVHSAVRSAFSTEAPAPTYHSQSTPVSLGSTPTGTTRSPLILSSVPKSPIIGPSVWSTTASEIRTNTSTPGQATPTGFTIPRPTSSTSIPPSSQGSPFFTSLLPPTTGRSSNPMPAFSLSSSSQPIPVTHMRSTSGNLSRTQVLAMEMMNKGTEEDEDTIQSTRRHKKNPTSTSGTIASLLNRTSDAEDGDELDLQSLMIDPSHPLPSPDESDIPNTAGHGRFRSISLNLPNHSSQAIAIASTSTSSTTSSWYGSNNVSPTSSGSQHHSPAHHSFSLPSAITSRGLPSPLQRLNAPLQISSLTQSGSNSPLATPSSPHGPIGSAPSSSSSSSRRLRLPIFANLSTTTTTTLPSTTPNPSNNISSTMETAIVESSISHSESNDH